MIRILVCALVLVATSALADDEHSFTWDPVTEADWNVEVTDADHARGAVILFERTERRERDLKFLRVYQRIRILNERGHDLGDVLLPADDDETIRKVFFVDARTVRRDGIIEPLRDELILARPGIEAGGVSHDASGYAVPGMSDDCIVDIVVALEMNEFPLYWMPSRDARVLSASLEWIAPRTFRSLFPVEWGDREPGYVTVGPHKAAVSRLAIDGFSAGFRFRYENLPQLRDEPYAPTFHGVDYVLLYRSARATAQDYWNSTASYYLNHLFQVGSRMSRVEDALSTAREIASPDARVAWLSNWLRDRVRHRHPTDGEFDPIRDINELLERGHGTQNEIDTALWVLLDDLDMAAYPAFVPQRASLPFQPDAQSMVPADMIVAFRSGTGNWRLVSPGTPFAPLFESNVRHEGQIALLATEPDAQFVRVPISPAHRNVQSMRLDVARDADGFVSGTAIVRVHGVFARELRVARWQARETDVNRWSADAVAARLI